MQCQIERRSRFKHTCELAHHGADDEFGQFDVDGQMITEGSTPIGTPQHHHRRHVQRPAQEGMADLGQTRLDMHATVVGLMRPRA